MKPTVEDISLAIDLIVAYKQVYSCHAIRVAMADNRKEDIGKYIVDDSLVEEYEQFTKKAFNGELPFWWGDRCSHQVARRDNLMAYMNWKSKYE